jgi:DNA-binding protein H-NS
MPYSIQLPDGSLVENIPDEITPREAKARIIKAYPQYAPESGDVFVPALKSGVSLAQEAGYALAGRTGLMDEAAAQKAIEEEQAYQQRVFKPTEEGFLEAPVTKTLELLGQSLPFMVLPVAAAGATLALPFTGAAATVAGLGAAGLASGAQFTGTNLLRQMEPTDEAPQGKSIGETDLGDAALAAVPQAALDVLSLRMMPFIRGVFGQVGKDLSEEAARRIASKNLKDVAADYALATGKTMTVEGLTEAAQQSLERLQAGLTMTDEAARDEYLESFIGGAVLGGVLAPPGRYLERRAAQKEVPPETKPEPTATQPTAPTPITDEDELTPEEEADLQARIAAAPPAAGLPVAATPTQPLAPSAAVQQVTASPEAVALPGTQQLTPQAAPELEVLTAQLARIQQARMDPTLSPDDPAFLEFDQQEAAIQARIQQLTAPPAAVTQPPVQPLAPPVAPVVEPEVIPEEAVVEAPVVTPPQIQGPRFGLSSVLDSPAQPLAPEITPPADVESVVTPAVEEPVIEEPVARIKQDVQTELNRMRTSLKKAKTAVRKKLMPESEVTKLETRVAELEDELVEAKAGPRQIKYRSAKGNTWTGKGKSPPKWLRQKLAAGFELSDFEIRPELGNKSEVEVELEKPPGFGRPMPATRPPEEYERMAARLERAEVGGPNLFNELKGKLRDEDVIDIGRGKEFSFLRAGKGKGKFLVDLIDDGELNEFLPEAMQPESETYDASKSDEYLKKLLREDQSTDPEARITPEARDFLIPYLRFEISQLEAELEPEDVNQLIQEIVAEERAAIADIEASAIAEQERGPGVPGVTPDFALTGQTPEELAELQRKELSGEAEAERDRLEAEEAALAAAEAERKIADQKRETFQLAPPPSAPAVQAAGPVGDLFGTTGIREQPTRAPRAVAAEPSPIEQMAEDARAAEEMGSPQQVLDDLIKELGRGVGKRRIETPDATTILTEETWDGDTTIKRFEFDAIVSLASKTDTPKGAKYSILIKDTPTESITFAFQPMGLKPLDRRVDMKYVLSKTTLDTEAPPLEDNITERMRQLGVADFEDASKKVQESYGVSKPVADAYVRAVRKQAEAIAKSSYGKATENEFQDAYDEAEKLRNRMEGIRKRKAPKEEKKEERPVEVQTWDVFYTGTSNLAAENIEASSAQKAKEIAAEKEGLKSIARLTAKKKEKRIKTEAAPTEKGKFTLSQDGIVGSEIEPSRVPNGNDAFQYAVGRVEQDGAEGVFRRRADERGTYGGWRVETSVDKLVPKKPSIRKTREVAEGTVVERIELPDNIEIRIVKLKNGYSVYQYDLDSDQIVMGQQNQFRSPAFKNDQDAYQAAEAFASDMFDKVVPKMAGEMQAAMKERLSRGEDVVNNKTPDPGIPADQRLVLMACCATKKKGMGMGPAIDVYTGVFFQTLKNKLKEGAMPNLRILSAKYGFIAPDQKIEVYDQVMDKSSADGFMLDDKLVEGFPSNIKDVLIVGSDQYQRVMKAAIEDLIKAGKIDKGASINVTKGGIGEQRAQLGRYLASLPVKKESKEKEDKPRATTAGMTITEIMAETERVKKQLAEMGMDPDVTYRPEDTSKEKREAKEAKRRTELTRLAGESSRIDKLTREPIIGNPGQRSAAERLARSVDGELLFLDGSRGLGIVFAKDREGNDAYLPIHAGKISRVDVRDFTGLKSTDQAYLKRVRSELVQDAGARQKRKDDEADMEFMLKGTEDEQKGIRAVAETVGGTPVYFDPDTNVGLVRGYGRLTGKPVYAMTMGDRYSTADVEESTVAVFAPYKAQLIEVKKRLEKEAEQKHKDDPFITFKNGVAMSESIDASIGGIITEWKSMLGLENVNVYFSTIEDAKKNRDNFTGPHRAIGSGTLDAGEGGSMRRMQDGSYYVLFTKGTSKTAMLEILAHELGHVHEREAYQNAPQELKDKLKEAHAKWVAQRRGKTAREAVNMLRAKTTAQTTSIAAGKERAEDLSPYWSSFSEWYADQVSRWAVTDEKPVGVVEKFFARLGAALRRFYQTLKGQKYLPDETFVQYLKQVQPTIVEEIPGPIKDPVQIEMSFQMQKDLFGSTQEAKQIEQIMEVKGKKKLPPGRSPELTAAAQAVQAGTMTAEEFNKLVDIYKPIPLYEEPLKPATSEQVFDALDVKKREQINPEIPNGTKVGLRLDIPAFNRKGVFVVSIHQKRTASAPGKVIGYGSVAKAKNVTFGVGNQLKALEIAAGSAKDALQTMEGDYVNVTPEQALAEAQRAIRDPSYVQIGIDPTRHAYFYDRRTTLPVVSAEEVIQIGNMILAKKPVFGSKQDFLYNIEGAPVQSAAELDAKRDRENQEKLQDLKDLRPTKIALPEKVRSYASSEEGQRVIAALNMTGEELERTVQKQYEGYTADNFMRRARKGLDEGEISADVFAVVQSMYMADPKLLDGLRLDVKQKFTPEELAQRRAEGKPSPMGAFAPFERVVNLYTGTKGVTDPMTIRHELTHTLEQMMTPVQRKAVINAYIAALKKAAKKHKDAKSREFFDNVVKYLNEPSNDTRDAMNKSLPSLDFYQFTSPSEYWAVNAEKLMAQRLGVPWDRFKKAVRKMFEKMKNIFGFDNRFVVHDVFDKIMSGSKERMDTEMLANFVASSKQEYEMIEKTKEDAELVRRYNRTPTSQTDSAPLRRIMIGAAENSKDLFKSMVESPSEAINFMFNSVNRGVMFLRNKFIWFGSGINETDRIRYNGAVKTAEGLATASVALDNMIRGGNIATQVIMQGGIEFNKNTQMYGAVQKDKSMANVYRAEAKLKEKLGDQLGTDIEQGYLQAKRSRSIIDEVETRTKIVERLNEQIDEMVAASKALDADPKATQKQKDDVNRELRRLFKEYRVAADELKTIKRIREDKVTMSEQEIADFIQREEAHPELKEILDNFNAVNQNLLRFWRDVGLLSEPRYERLSSIKDYVPWYRVMDDDADIHDPVQATTRSATNIGKEKLFKAGKPSVVTDFTVEENQKVFKVQPGAVNAVKLNGIRLKPDQYDVQPNGEITLKVEAKPGQLLVVETQREIENMIDNMTRNVMRMTMNGLRKYAANRIVSEYATREAGKIKRFATADRNKGRFDYIENGRRTIVEIQDPLIAEAVLGMETVGMKMWEPLAAAANFTRRTITLSPVFQLKQVFKDAPTAALVTGVRNPAALMGGVMRDFIGAVRGDDPVAEILRSQGIGGFYSPARTPEADVKRQIGIINNNTYDYVMKALDHFGDSSDMAQRIAIYKRVMAETGDETLALYQAANVINFLRHGSGQVAQALVKTVPFLNAYAQSIDVLYDALRGGGLRGKDRAAALQQLAITGSLLAGTTLIYAMLVGDDDDYMKMDDQSKIRSYMIPGTDVVLPMNTSAAFFFKAIPELLYNKVVNEGTETEVDAKRLRTAMKEAAVDLLLGPTPVPSAVKPIIEIGLDYNFFTSRPVTPRGMQSLDAYQQYDMRTSEAAKILSSLTGTDEKRVLNPMEADHLVRSIFGTAGAMVAWSSNLVGEAAEFRPEMG